MRANWKYSMIPLLHCLVRVEQIPSPYKIITEIIRHFVWLGIDFKLSRGFMTFPHGISKADQSHITNALWLISLWLKFKGHKNRLKQKTVISSKYQKACSKRHEWNTCICLFFSPEFHTSVNTFSFSSFMSHFKHISMWNYEKQI